MPKQPITSVSAQADEEWFEYGCANSAIFHTLALVGASVAFLVLIDLLVSLYEFVLGSGPDIAQLVASLGYFLLLSFYSLAISSAYPNFHASDAGLTVQVFIFWWVFIPWKDVRDIRGSLWGTSKLVFVRGLTPIHRVYGWIFGLAPRPAFVITRRIRSYDRAVKTIQSNCGKL